jgi:hypothetical protein
MFFFYIEAYRIVLYAGQLENREDAGGTGQ